MLLQSGKYVLVRKTPPLERPAPLLSLAAVGLFLNALVSNHGYITAPPVYRYTCILPTDDTSETVHTNGLATGITRGFHLRLY